MPSQPIARADPEQLLDLLPQSSHSQLTSGIADRGGVAGTHPGTATWEHS